MYKRFSADFKCDISIWRLLSSLRSKKCHCQWVVMGLVNVEKINNKYKYVVVMFVVSLQYAYTIYKPEDLFLIRIKKTYTFTVI